jgi:hypothetical protein
VESIILEEKDQSQHINQQSNERVNKLRELALTKRLNFLIGSGASLPGIPLMNDERFDPKNILPFSDKYGKSRNDLLLDEVTEISKTLINQDFTKFSNTIKTLENYKGFLSVVIDIQKNSNARQVPRTANIFTTNYDLFLEKAADSLIQNQAVIFNDGAKGYFNRYLDSSNFNMTVSYRGLNDNHRDDLPTITLIKPHGSVNWEKDNEKLLIRNQVVEKPTVVKPNGYENSETFMNNHFHDMLRVFQLELDKPESVLFVVGFSFQDKHIAKMLKRALDNNRLIVICFGYSDLDESNILCNLGIGLERVPSNLWFITPKDLPTYLDKLDLPTVTKLLRGDVSND